MKTRNRTQRESVFPSVARNIEEHRKKAFKITGKKIVKTENKPSN